MGTAGLVFLLRHVAFESIRLLRAVASLLVFCDWRMVPNLCARVSIECAGLRYQNMVIWDKSAWASAGGFRAQHEVILHFHGQSSLRTNDKAPLNKRASAARRSESEHQTEKPVKPDRTTDSGCVPPGGVVPTRSAAAAPPE